MHLMMLHIHVYIRIYIYIYTYIYILYLDGVAMVARNPMPDGDEVDLSWRIAADNRDAVVRDLLMQRLLSNRNLAGIIRISASIGR